MAANPCPCGRLGVRPPSGASGNPYIAPDPQLAAIPGAQGCFCSSDEIRRYWRKFGAALLDRVELRVAVASPGLERLAGEKEESSTAIAKRVLAAVKIQRERFKNSVLRRNAHMSAGLIDRYCVLSENAEKAFRSAAEKLALSGRAYHGALRVARTIADLEGQETIKTVHILEAIQHRRLGEDPYDVFSAEG
jgi:magnesium chelatase family protein